MNAEVDREALVAHLRDSHLNLLSTVNEALPGNGDLAAAPIGLLRAVHEANHAAIHRPHPGGDYPARGFFKPESWWSAYEFEDGTVVHGVRARELRRRDLENGAERYDD